MHIVQKGCVFFFLVHSWLLLYYLQYFNFYLNENAYLFFKGWLSADNIGYQQLQIFSLYSVPQIPYWSHPTNYWISVMYKFKYNKYIAIYLSAVQILSLLLCRQCQWCSCSRKGHIWNSPSVFFLGYRTKCRTWKDKDRTSTQIWCAETFETRLPTEKETENVVLHDSHSSTLILMHMLQNVGQRLWYLFSYLIDHVLLI